MATLAGRATSNYRLRALAPAAQSHWRRDEQWHERPGVAQFVYLSMLLHATAILLFGAPPGGSREGRAMWGSLNVQLVAPAGPIEVPTPMASIAPMPLPKLEREFRPARPFVTPQVVVPSKLERIAPPQLKLDRMLPTPRIEVVPLPAPPAIAVPAPIAPIVPRLPTVERTMVEPPKIVAPLAQPIAPPVKERAPPPVEVPRVETTVLPALPAAPALPAIERAPELAPKIVAPAAPPAPEPVAPKIETPPDAPMSREELFAPRAPAPAAPVPVAPERRAADGDYDPTKPAIDLETARKRASEIARQGVGQRALLPFPMPAPPPRKSKTEEALEKARKPDCRTAYQGLGLLAAVPLIANEFGEGTCRW
jgi:hypothetical protein